MSFQTEALSAADEILLRAERDLALVRELLQAVSVKRNRELLSRLLSGVQASCEIVRLSIRRPGE